MRQGEQAQLFTDGFFLVKLEEFLFAIFSKVGILNNTLIVSAQFKKNRILYLNTKKLKIFSPNTQITILHNNSKIPFLKHIHNWCLYTTNMTCTLYSYFMSCFFHANEIILLIICIFQISSCVFSLSLIRVPFLSNSQYQHNPMDLVFFDFKYYIFVFHFFFDSCWQYQLFL